MQNASPDPLRFLRFTMDSLPIGVFTVDANRRVTSFNPQAETITGYSKEEVLGRYCGEVLQGGMCKTQCPLASVIRRRTPLVRLETTIQDRNGKTIPVSLQTAALLDDEGRLLGGVETFQDISYLKSLERDKAAFVSMIAHDMKSSLTIIGGFARRLQKPAARKDGGKSAQYLDIVLNETERLESMIQDFLEFSRLETGRIKLDLRPVPLNEEIERLVTTSQLQAEHLGIRMAFHPDPRLGTVTADAERLRRVFRNLLDNALKFSESGGKVTVTTQDADAFVRVLVADEGVGIEAAKLPRVFVPYFRAHDNSKTRGFGVGLATVKAVVEEHGGHVEVESEPARGSTFTVHLPKAPVAGEVPA
ncbi:MAG: PAS domain S-box protein [Deltaproteobacteria bacterium]|nr:PAS domain S-box protein [Deltaproteobacteria bacterium]